MGPRRICYLYNALVVTEFSHPDPYTAPGDRFYLGLEFAYGRLRCSLRMYSHCRWVPLCRIINHGAASGHLPLFVLLTDAIRAARLRLGIGRRSPQVPSIANERNGDRRIKDWRVDRRVAVHSIAPFQHNPASPRDSWHETDCLDDRGWLICIHGDRLVPVCPVSRIPDLSAPDMDRHFKTHFSAGGIGVNGFIPPVTGNRLGLGFADFFSAGIRGVFSSGWRLARALHYGYARRVRKRCLAARAFAGAAWPGALIPENPFPAEPFRPGGRAGRSWRAARPAGTRAVRGHAAASQA